MIKAVLFDYSGVFTTPPLKGLEDVEAQMGYPCGSLEAAFWGDYGDISQNHPWHQLERGEIPFAEFWSGLLQRCRSHFGDDFDAQVYLGALRDGFAVHFPMVEKTRELRGTYRTALLTNNVKEFGDGWRATIPVEDLFDHVVDSSEIGSRKPEPAFYHRALQLVGVHPTEAVFLDDMKANVDGAEALGISAIHVLSTAQAIADLEAALAS